MTLDQLSKSTAGVPTSIAWSLADVGEAIGKQALFTRQSPQRLRVLREHALIESTVSSNRIEGVEVERRRVGTLVFGRPALLDRSEEELAGYRDALDMIHSRHRELPITERTVRTLHRLTRGRIWDAGRYKSKDGDIIETQPDGRRRIRFSPVPARETPAAMKRLLSLWKDTLRERRVHPLVALGAFGLDFLCVHPFRDGNGRVSRLLLLLQGYHIGLEVGRYISLERVIEQNKERYYETLEMCSRGWHEGRHDPWPFIGFVLYVLKLAYAELERRVGETADPRGAKLETVRAAILRRRDDFRIADVERDCPGVSADWVRGVMRKMRDAGELKCLGRGRGTRWRLLPTPKFPASSK